MEVDRSKALELIDRAIEQGKCGVPDDFESWRESARVAIRIALGEDDPTMGRFDKIRYSPGLVTENTSSESWIRARAGGVKRALAILAGVRRELETSEPASVAVDIGALHPWVSGAAASLWVSGYYRQAVEEAARTIEVQVRAKLELSGGTGVRLVTDAFSTKAPGSAAPRLRFREFPSDSDSWTNAHEGAMAFGRGCMMRIRNLYSHGHDPEVGEALEALASLSLLARWIEGADVVRS